MTWRSALPPDPIFVLADTTRLSQVFANLLNNAAKYTERGGRIRLKVERRAEKAVISVQDNGIGIPRHMLSQVFDMFTQIDRNLERSQSGLGIGLSIVKRLVEMHGGAIEAMSEGKDKGSEFLVRLPIIQSLPRIQVPDHGQAVSSVECVASWLWMTTRTRRASLAMLLELMGNQTQIAGSGARH